MPFAQKLGLLRDRGGSMRRPCAPDPDPRRGAGVDSRAPALAACRLFRGRALGGGAFLDSFFLFPDSEALFRCCWLNAEKTR